MRNFPKIGVASVFLQFKQMISSIDISARTNSIYLNATMLPSKHFQQLNQSSSLSLLLQCPEMEIIQSGTIIHLTKTRHHPNKSVLYPLQQYFVLTAMQSQCMSTIHCKWSDQLSYRAIAVYNETCLDHSQHIICFSVCHQTEVGKLQTIM